MVLLHLLQSENVQFLYETTCSTPIIDILPVVLRLNNVCQQVSLLIAAFPSLITSGPAAEITEPLEEGKDVPRMGQPPPDHVREMLERTMNEAKTAISAQQVNMKVTDYVNKANNTVDTT